MTTATGTEISHVITMLPQPTISLYVHFPWCIKKCPYCDFNSHQLKQALPEQVYINCLLRDLDQDLVSLPALTLSSIFFGGGTPSLFSPAAMQRLLDGLQRRLSFSRDIEITLEANPGTIDSQHFVAYRSIGINRLSIGIQSFSSSHLTALGRIHDSEQAKRAIEISINAGFDNINLDLMYGLPQQTRAQALDDVVTAIDFQVNHISWYQLTLEPNTLFHAQPPPLPNDDACWAMQTAGQAALQAAGYQQYEISAYCRQQAISQHNLNYWRYGDYLGIGAGAHSKFTQADGTIVRCCKHKHPRTYMNDTDDFVQSRHQVEANDRVFEFFLNQSRLLQPISKQAFRERTSLSSASIDDRVQQALALELIHETTDHWQVTAKGRQYLNDLQAIFLTETDS